MWSGPDTHQRYTARDLPALRSRANLAADVRALTGHVLPLEPDWRVLPERPHRAPGIMAS
ncbi:hypothetical protein [Kitasatospora aureofaciens]|uniref:hypothetical protein n=1 Tax=Kitasatospora aureofaciens TaxID=1894 RepID=UPI001C4729D8|nr:hypothetical protein [Kitasatospora aureofaciens]MBV6700179.1 hypothetical protein [Kitasatospora aureofaciens]